MEEAYNSLKIYGTFLLTPLYFIGKAVYDFSIEERQRFISPVRFKDQIHDNQRLVEVRGQNRRNYYNRR